MVRAVVHLVFSGPIVDMSSTFHTLHIDPYHLTTTKEARLRKRKRVGRAADLQAGVDVQASPYGLSALLSEAIEAQV